MSPPVARVPGIATAPEGGDHATLVEAVSEVDQSLLDWALSVSPRERLRAAHRAAAVLARLQRDAPSRG